MYSRLEYIHDSTVHLGRGHVNNRKCVQCADAGGHVKDRKCVQCTEAGGNVKDRKCVQCTDAGGM